MEFFYLLLILILLAFASFLGSKIRFLKHDNNTLQREMDEWKGSCSGLGGYNQKMQEIKDQKKNKIMELFADGKTSNTEVADHVQISRSSAFRYLEELEKEGKIQQVGKKGAFVIYSKIS